MTTADDFIRHMQNQDPAELDRDREEAWSRKQTEFVPTAQDLAEMDATADETLAAVEAARAWQEGQDTL